MKVRTSSLEGAALDWAVAKCEKLPVAYDGKCIRDTPSQFSEGARFEPSSDWSQAGPIIERELISIFRLEDSSRTDADGYWIPGRDIRYGATHAHHLEEDVLRSIYGEDFGDIYYTFTDNVCIGESALVAAMRCYVREKLGSEVQIPDELM
jgi:hypothetical protein